MCRDTVTGDCDRAAARLSADCAGCGGPAAGCDAGLALKRSTFHRYANGTAPDRSRLASAFGSTHRRTSFIKCTPHPPEESSSKSGGVLC